MKRFCLSVGIFLSFVLISVFGSFFVEESYKKISSELICAEHYIYKEDFSAARQTAENAEELFHSRERLLAAFVDRAALEEAGAKLAAVSPLAQSDSRGEFLSHSAQARVALIHLRNAVRLTAGSLY